MDKSLVEEATGSPGVKYVFMDINTIPPRIHVLPKEVLATSIEEDIERKSRYMRRLLESNDVARKFFEDLGLL